MAVDLSYLAGKAKQAGCQEVLKLLQEPEDLLKLPDLISEYASKAQANKASLSSLVRSQVEAARRGLDLVDKSHRHVLKLRSNIDSIHRLCSECTSLVDHQDKIRVLSQTHANLQKVLAEIKDIIDLPDRAEVVLGLLDDPANILPAYEALTVLEGTADNAREAWNRNVKAGQHDMSSMMQYLQRVKSAMAQFEEVLWAYLEQYEELAQDNPMLLVDCLRIVEIQEGLDKQAAKTKGAGPEPKRFRRRFQDMVAQQVAARFEPLLEAAPKCGQPNKKVRYTQEGDLVVAEERDYLGTLLSITLLDSMTGQQDTLTDPGRLRGVEVIEEEAFDEKEFLDFVLEELYAVEEVRLAAAYDFVLPCFPPRHNIFDTIFQLHHVQVATVIDTIGQRANSLSTQGALRIMEFVRKYMTTLRGLGVEEQLVRLPVSPTTDPDTPPGLTLLMSSYISKMERTVTSWYNNIMVVDLEYEPKPGPSGKLRTAGVTDFFRIMNEEIEVIRSIDDHGDVMFQTAQMALRIMRGFQAEQTKVISDTELQLSFEMFCALLNNNVECHDQSLEFVEEVQEQLDEEYRDKLDQVDDVCRGFLDVAKVAMARAVVVMFNDPGMSGQLIALYSRPEWLSGKTTTTLIATIKDYMADVQRFVEPSFVKRVAEAALEELGRRAVNMFTAGVLQVTAGLVSRMEADEVELDSYFKDFVKPDRRHKLMQTLVHMRTLVSCPTVPDVVSAYRELVASHVTFSFDLLQKIVEARGTFGGFEKKHTRDVLAQCKEIWQARLNAMKDTKEQARDARGGFFSWGRK
ncbi:component of the exocyst complex [Haematococcus lacustris]